MKRPAQIHAPALRRMPEKLPTLSYPLHDDVIDVDQRGHVRVRRRAHYVARALAEETLGLREEDDGRLLLSFAALDLGHISEDGTTFTPLSA